ncbi:MAG: acyltransferase family protein [Syntrophales bacterium]|nr:acyltransferase family protein [Syntrophales bacterium]
MSDKDRRFDLDWVRVITILVVFVFHCGRFFDSVQWHLKNAELSFPVEVFNFFANAWQMPLLFLVAGAAAWFSLAARQTGRFLNERVNRLLVPLAFGILVIVPPQVYMERIYKHQFDGSFIAFYPHFFQGIYSYTGAGNFSWHHLWFLSYLFIITLLALPLFLFLRSDKGKRVLDKMASFVSRRGAIFALFLPMWLVLASLLPVFPGYTQDLVSDWAFFLNYFCYFVYGYIFCSDARFWKAIERQRYIALALAVAASVAIAYLELSKSMPAFGYIPQWIAVIALRAFCSWCWINTFLGFAKKCLSFSNSFLKYASEAVLPFYILHHMVIIIVGFYVIQWDIPVLAKYGSIIAISFVLIMLLYEFVVKRTNVTRLLFGMRPMPKGVKE